MPAPYLTALCVDPSGLATHPSVSEVRRSVVLEQPKTHILHLADWHAVDHDAFAVDLGLAGEAFDEKYSVHLAKVAAVQLDQRAVL